MKQPLVSFDSNFEIKSIWHLKIQMYDYKPLKIQILNRMAILLIFLIFYAFISWLCRYLLRKVHIVICDLHFATSFPYYYALSVKTPLPPSSTIQYKTNTFSFYWRTQKMCYFNGSFPVACETYKLIDKMESNDTK